MVVRGPPFGFPREYKLDFPPRRVLKTLHRSSLDSAVSPFHHGYLSRSPRRAANPFSIDSRDLLLSRRDEFLNLLTGRFWVSCSSLRTNTPKGLTDGEVHFCSIALGSLVRFQLRLWATPASRLRVEFLGIKEFFRTSSKKPPFRSS
jgi:hypothetical protein